MKFILKKEVDYGQIRPHPDAFMMTVPYWHTRTVTEDVFDQKFGKHEGLWRSKGKNHQTTHDGEWITRQEEGREVWGIELKTLEEFLLLVKEFGYAQIAEYEDGNEDGLFQIEKI